MIFICIYLVINDTENFPVLNGHLCTFLCVVSIKSYAQLYCVSFNKQKGRKRGRKVERSGGGREGQRKTGSSIKQLHKNLQWLPHQTGTWRQIQTSKFNITSWPKEILYARQRQQPPWAHLKLRNSGVIHKAMPDG